MTAVKQDEQTYMVDSVHQQGRTKFVKEVNELSLGLPLKFTVVHQS